jgi:hypothetical protein
VIRRAGPDDTPAIVNMGARLHATGPWADVEYDHEATALFVAGILERGAIFLSDDGMCGGAIFPFYVNPQFMVATEFFWWAPKGGQPLRDAFEAWATENGASAVLFSGLQNERLPAVTRIYRRAGYTPGELSFVKRVA